MILSLTVHEWAHAFSAYKLGDDTAAREGRLTLNPLVHIDPLGTILLPLLGVPFGWAKPVPINPARFTRRVTLRMGVVYTAAAGPLSNLVLVVLCAVAYGLALRFAGGSLGLGTPLTLLLTTSIMLNIALAVFNMLPIPPLDGSRVVDGLLPHRFEAQWERYCKYAPFLLAAVIILPNILHFPLLQWPLELIATVVWKLVAAVAGLKASVALGPPPCDAAHMMPGLLAGLALSSRRGTRSP
jgi:Zn-dependent protease